MIALFIIATLAVSALGDAGSVKLANGPPVLGHFRVNGKYIDDMVEGSSTRNAIADKEKRWRNNLIPYQYGWAGYTAEQKQDIEKAMKSIQDNTCISFVPKDDSHVDYVTFINELGTKNEGACMTMVGREGGEQKIWLSYVDKGNGRIESCLRHDIIVHELMHVIGLDHEHNRFDRDQYVDVNLNVVETDMVPQFEKVDDALTSNFSCPYTYESVMHYDKTSFGAPQGIVTMTPQDNKYNDIIGRVADAHPNDYEKINRVYGCHQTKVVKGHTCGPMPAIPCEDTKDPKYAQLCPAIKGNCDKYPGPASKCLKTCNRCM